MRNLYYILFLFLLVSCADKNMVTSFDTGEKYEEYEYKGDGLKHGIYKRFSKGGILLEESMYDTGKLNGERKLYDKKGNVEILEIYVNDILNGAYTEYHPNGKIKFVGQYVDNVLAGEVKVYYPSGAVKEEVLFEDSVENGPFKEYHENGNLKWEGTYRNGDNEFGLLKKYDEEGTLIRKMMCDDRAVCTTTWTIDGSHLKEMEN